ncbi:ABC1 kinase family protein [Microlunatus soli]|uniref:Ubiquinone biosynthesis protein n=1 Tax=Microlunatus soli TaxID=630515 RepID=A0A1H1W2L9_9ACTN|nr:AarF/ABC1/UbiB kinase family protein [Microlunatus soli]SDS91295.1 ubiquinone biosynthesis protein [Microlunatus soli]
MNVLSGLAQIVFALGSLVIASVLLALLCRRVLGVPVGWPRSIVIGGGMTLASFPVMGVMLTRQGLLDGTRLVGDPAEATLLIGIGMLTVFGLALIVLVIAEVIVPTGSLGNPCSLITDTRARLRRGRRYTGVLAILAKHGLSSSLRIGGRRDVRRDRSTPRSLAAALGEAGVTFIKLGQTLSTRPDIIPESYIRELSRLQDDAGPLPWSRLQPVLAEELSRPPEEVFEHIDPTPLATASIGQVHTARLLDGTDVVIKIRRPGAAEQVEVDLDIMGRLARQLERTADWARSLGAVRLARGFADSLIEELDYRVEAENVAAVAGSLAGSERIGVPRVYDQLSGPSVLIMERIVGTPLGQASELITGFDVQQRAEMAEGLLTEVLREILFTGTFHADLHPGNIIVGDDGRLTLLDFGSVGRLDQPSRTALGLLLLAVERDDPIGAADALTELLDHQGERLDRRQLERDIGQLIVRYRGGIGSAGSAGMFAALWKLITSHRFSVPPQVGAAMRSLAGLETSVRAIDPNTDIVTAARGEGAALVGEITDPAAVRVRVERELFRMLPMLQRLPQRVNRIADDLENGRFTAQVRVLADPADRTFLSRLVGQISITLVAAAAVLSAMLLITTQAGPVVTGDLRLYPLLGVILLFFGVILGLRVMVVALSAFDDHRR